MRIGKKPFVLIVLLLAGQAELCAQRYITRSGTISFYSEAPLENIEAVNNQVSSALDLETGNFVFRVLMRAFQFEKALMQEHFNDNFLESHNYPNASFEGKVKNLDAGELNSGRTMEVEVDGKLTIKGVTKDVVETGTLVRDGDVIRGKSVFFILLADYGIRIPAAVSRNISPEIQITVDLELHPMNQ